LKHSFNVKAVEPILSLYEKEKTPDATAALKYFNVLREHNAVEPSHYETILNILKAAKMKLGIF
jgi:hypothetical protein